MIRIEYVDAIPPEVLREIWQEHYPSQPLPNVKAYHVSAQQLVDFVQTLRGAATYIDTRVIEYGEWIADTEICAFTAHNVDRDLFIILRRLDSRASLEEDLRHELQHIHDQRAYGHEPLTLLPPPVSVDTGVTVTVRGHRGIAMT